MYIYTYIYYIYICICVYILFYYIYIYICMYIHVYTCRGESLGTSWTKSKRARSAPSWKRLGINI